ncbi:hypothetical protein STEG23_025270 [Scotinomys teguina]
MASWWRGFPRAARRYPWPTNVLLYAGLFSAGDALQQRLRGGPTDWRQTRRVATLAITFHGNFNYVWLRLLERALPGRAPRTVLAKVLCDQTVGGPIALSAFYVGMSILQGKDDIFLDLKQKFWNTYKVITVSSSPVHGESWSSLHFSVGSESFLFPLPELKKQGHLHQRTQRTEPDLGYRWICLVEMCRSQSK